MLDLQMASWPVDGRQHLTAPRADLHAHHPEMDAGPDVVVERLEAWRAQAAQAARVSPEAVLDDRTLHAIAAVSPRSPEELVGVPGLGPVKAARFAESLLAALHPD